MQGEAYFISPDGKIEEVPDRHILVVGRTPERFGLTRKQFDAAYAREGEPRGSEGTAREVILRRVIDKGWARIREYVGAYWSFQFSEWTPLVRRRARRWAKQVLQAGSAGRSRDPYLPVKFVGLTDGVRVEAPLRTVAFGKNPARFQESRR